jgi:hypothetical protein
MEKRKSANQKLEDRLIYLWKKKEITLHGNVENILQRKIQVRENPVPENHPKHLLYWSIRARTMYSVNGTKETVEASSDKYLKKYYEQSVKECSGPSPAQVYEHFQRIAQSEAELLKEIRNERFIG